MSGLTQEIARFASHPGFNGPPAEAVAIAKSGFIDVSGTMIGGRDEPPVRIALDHVRRSGQASVPEASLFYGRERAAGEAAALVNGMAAHVLDYDDVSLRAHPSTVLVPAILAEAERTGASGAEALRAYVVGYEVWAELDEREPDAIHLKGWHPTSAVGVVGATAALANLLGLDAERTRNAIALSASLSGGVVANFGTMAKSFQVGRAAANAVAAVRLAEAGMDASAEAIEAPNGLLAALSEKGAADRAGPARLGMELRILSRPLSFKKYPTCYCTHRVADAVIDLAKEHGLEAGAVRSVTARIGRVQDSMLRCHEPHTALEAKFSIEFAVAAGIVSRALGRSELTPDYINRPEVQGLIGKVRVELDDTVCPVEPAFSLNDRVRIELEDGRVIDSGDIRFARGHARKPLAEHELRFKFMDCCAGAEDIDAARLYGRLSALETLSDMRALARPD